MKVVLLPQAQENLDEIYDPPYTRILKRLRMLEKTPESGVALAGPFTGYRSTVVGLFRIIYRIVDRKTVEIAYIRHCKRAPLA